MSEASRITFQGVQQVSIVVGEQKVSTRALSGTKVWGVDAIGDSCVFVQSRAKRKHSSTINVYTYGA